MTTTAPADSAAGREVRESVVIRFSGDSGDGMQLTGTQFTVETALAGSDLATFPDYPAEIRAPAGTTFGVSSFQIHFGSRDILTAGDSLDVLVAMNPAALIVNLPDLELGGLVVADTGAFTPRNLEKAGYPANPLEGDQLAQYRVLPLDVTKLTQAAVKDFGLTSKEQLRCRNMWALGLMLWMYGRDHEGDGRLAPAEIRQGATRRRSEHRGPQGGARLRRDRRDAGARPRIHGAAGRTCRRAPTGP
jgi:2-oxoglutarate/2-oxoacid ferredoxin oxidoreductase subunit alpha